MTRSLLPDADHVHPDLAVLYSSEAGSNASIAAYERVEGEILRLREALEALSQEFALRGHLGASSEDVAMYLRMAREGLHGN